MTQTTFAHGYALLIGIGADLPVTIQDAKALHDVLVDPIRAAYPAEHVQLLTEQGATRGAILTAFDRLIEQVKQNTEATVIVYFSGHGGYIRREGKVGEYFLLPHGYNRMRHANTAISGIEFTSKIEAIKARKLIVLLDCCHAGGISALKGEDEEFEKAAVPPTLIQALESGSGRVVIASSLSSEMSYTGMPYSIFTACLLDALAGKAATKQDGFARILDTLSYLFEQVPLRTSDRQHPFVNKVLNLTENFPLCYSAGGKSDNSDPSPILPLTNSKKHRLEERRNMLQEEWSKWAEVVRRIRRALIAENNVVHQYKLEQDLLEREEAMTKVERELDEIEHQLNSTG